MGWLRSNLMHWTSTTSSPWAGRPSKDEARSSSWLDDLDEAERRFAALVPCWPPSSFILKDVSWRRAFTEPSRGASMLHGVRLLRFRWTLFLVWLYVFVWSIVYDASARTGFHGKGSYLPSVQDDSDDVMLVGDWSTKLTHWSAIQELIYFGLAALVSSLAFYSDPTSLPDGMGGDTPLYVRLCIALQASNLVCSFYVFIFYWLFDWPYKELFPSVPYPTSPFTHGLNFVLSALDFFVVGVQLDMTMYGAPLCFFAAYLVSSLVCGLNGMHSYGQVMHTRTPKLMSFCPSRMFPAACLCLTPLPSGLPTAACTALRLFNVGLVKRPWPCNRGCVRTRLHCHAAHV